MASRSDEPKPPIELVLITGFLGAGKTTFLNSLLMSTGADRLNDGRPPLGLLINDFGRVVVDGALVEEQANSSEGMEIYEVADGSIFCSCKTASFVAGLRMFARRRPHRLYVEASGMSDPSGLSKLLRENRLASDYVITDIVCLVDATRFEKLIGTLTAIERQVLAADLILINKADLASQSALESLEQQLSAINPMARVERVSFGRIDTVALGGKKSLELTGDLVSCSTPETRPAALQLEHDLLDRSQLDAFAAQALPLAYRIKGWVTVGRWYYLSDNAGALEWTEREPPNAEVAGLTVICPPGNVAAIADLWDSATGGV
ncbi:MAG: GTP-binding protein [Spirochaetales bacterium]